MATLTGKSALITGASRGIGAAIAQRLAKEGAEVAITYSSSAERARQLVRDIADSGRRAIAIKADAIDQDAIRNAVNATAKEFTKVDILVSNAGVLALGPIANFRQTNLRRRFQSMYAVCLLQHRRRCDTCQTVDGSSISAQ